MNEWYNGEGDIMNNIYERLNQFLWSHPTYKKVVGFLTIALKYIMMASYVMLLIGFYITHDDYLIYAIIKPCAAFLIVTVIRKLINQSRPYDYLEVTPLFEHREGCSFPSRHAASAFIIAFTAIHFDLYIGIVMLIFAFLTAITRVLSGLHHISDVTAGMVLSLIIELIILAIGLSMDAFAVSICKGLAARKTGIKEMCIAGLWFGGFQGLMPFIGWILGSRFKSYIENFDHWIAFVLLVLIGLNMIREALFEKENEENTEASFSFKTMLPMSVATSIDALAVGVTFGLLLDSMSKIVSACSLICATTFSFSAAGVKIGSVFGNKLQKQAEILGGITLMLIGIKTLLSHLGVISF